MCMGRLVYVCVHTRLCGYVCVYREYVCALARMDPSVLCPQLPRDNIQFARKPPDFVRGRSSTRLFRGSSLVRFLLLFLSPFWLFLSMSPHVATILDPLSYHLLYCVGTHFNITLQRILLWRMGKGRYDKTKERNR